jgi:two-component system, NarL family, nitrate/nitrite response regulator NarL
MIRVLIVAEVRLFREGIAAFLTGIDDMEVVGSFADWTEALATAVQHDPDIVLLESSAHEARVAVRRFEAVGTDTRVVALSILDDETDVLAWAEAGASGYLTREDSMPNLEEVVRSVSRGEMPCTPRIAASLLRRVGMLTAAAAPPPAEARLTARQRQIVELIERGLSNKEIAGELYIETTTVKNHVHNILEKLDVRRRADAVDRMRGRVSVAPELTL